MPRRTARRSSPVAIGRDYSSGALVSDSERNRQKFHKSLRPALHPPKFDCAVFRAVRRLFGCKIDSCWNGNED